MKNIFIGLLFCSFNLGAIAGSYLDWRLGYKTIKIDSYEEEIRIGYLVENSNVKFKGNILYYQGLGDSMLNHDPLFESLTKTGYRVIAFDYMGQGGSSGTMNNTTIKNINELGDKVVSLLKRKNTEFGDKYHIIGWSTGGLAAYRKAFYDKNNTVMSVIMIAPGIAPNYLVGEGLFNWPIDEITLRTLTGNTFEGENDPHEDPIFPTSPIYVPKFAIDLQRASLKARKSWDIREDINGLVFLSGPNDTYVNAKKTKSALSLRAKHFEVISYDDALHEIDNEINPIAQNLRKRILDFLIKSHK